MCVIHFNNLGVESCTHKCNKGHSIVKLKHFCGGSWKKNQFSNPTKGKKGFKLVMLINEVLDDQQKVEFKFSEPATLSATDRWLNVLLA